MIWIHVQVLTIAVVKFLILLSQTIGTVSYTHLDVYKRQTMRSNSRDGYQVHFLGEEGIMLRNPLSCGILYCDAEDQETIAGENRAAEIA